MAAAAAAAAAMTKLVGYEERRKRRPATRMAQKQRREHRYEQQEERGARDMRVETWERLREPGREGREEMVRRRADGAGSRKHHKADR